MKSILFYVAMNLEAFIYCFCGEYLSAKVSTYRKINSFINSQLSQKYLVFFLFQSKMIGSAIYDSLWYNVSAKETQNVLFLIVRSQKRLTITSGKIVDLSLERFTSVRFYDVFFVFIYVVT